MTAPTRRSRPSRAGSRPSGRAAAGMPRTGSSRPGRSPPQARTPAAHTGPCGSPTSAFPGRRRCASGPCRSTSPTTASARCSNTRTPPAPGRVQVSGPAGAAAPTASCASATRRVNRLQRRIRAAKRRGASTSACARSGKRALRKLKRKCGAPVTASPPATAPPGCRLVTKTVLKQEGIGIYAKWVLKPEVVVECSK